MTFRYTIGQLKQVKNFFRENPEGRVKVNPVDGFTQTFDRDSWFWWLRGCLNAKINRESPMNGRKHDPDYWTEMRRAQDQLNHPRLRIYWLPKDLKERFQHRICDRSEI